MENLEFYKETLDKINKIVNETSAPYAQILMFGGKLPDKERKTLDDIGKITTAVFDILQENGYEIEENGNLLSVELDGNKYYCAKSENTEKKRPIEPEVTQETPKKDSTEAPVEVKEEQKPAIEKDVKPAAEEIKEESKSEISEEPSELQLEEKQEEISDNPWAGINLTAEEEPKEELKEEPVADIWQETKVNAAENNKPEEPKQEEKLEIDNPWGNLSLEDIDDSEDKDGKTAAEPAMEDKTGSEADDSDNPWANISLNLETEEKKEEAAPETTSDSKSEVMGEMSKWWAQIDETIKEDEEPVKKFVNAEAIESVATKTVEEKQPQEDIPIPSRVKFNFNGTGFANDKEGTKTTFSTPQKGIIYDLFEITIDPPVETGYRQENIKAMVAPVIIPSYPAPSVPFVASFTYRGKHYSISSLEQMEEGRNLCLIHIEQYCFLIRGWYDDDMVFQSMICTAGQSIKDGIRLNVLSHKKLGTILYPGEEVQNGLAFTANTSENRTDTICNIFPLTDDGKANFVCVSRIKSFLDYHYHSENIHGAQEINMNNNNEKTIIRCKYENDLAVAEVVEVI